MFRKKVPSCTHNWIVIMRRFTPPVVGIKNVKANSSKYIETAERSLFGFTTIEQQCRICHLSTFTIAKGNQINGKNL